MNSLWKQNFLEVDDEIKNPRSLIEDQCESLNEMTKNCIIARILEYDGAVESYTKAPFQESMLSLAKSMSSITSKSTYFDVQSVLGEVGDENDINYEFFITSKRTPRYKFRAFFMHHGISIYPVTFIIEEGIASEIFGSNESEKITIAHNEEEFLSVFSKIINSERLTSVIKNLMKLN